MSCVALPCLAGSADADFSYRLSPSARLAVVVNPQSGDRSGQHWLDWFAATHPQVRRVDLTKSDADILDGEPELPPLDRVIIAGGDGTVMWALNRLRVLTGAAPLPAVALLPVGVGNELSRCLGWSAGWRQAMPLPGAHSGAVARLLSQVMQGSRGTKTVDTWRVTIDGADGEGEAVDMCCFCSIGFDADISNDFQSWRTAHPDLLSSIAVNKAAYAVLGVRALLLPPPPVSDVTLMVDGDEVAVPPGLRSIQVFNCHSSADGLDFFGCGQDSTTADVLKSHAVPDCGDGLLEVVATYGVSHLMQIRMGMGHSVRLAQGHSIELRLPGRHLVAQVDGESIKPSQALRIERLGNFNALVGHGQTRGLGHYDKTPPPLSAA